MADRKQRRKGVRGGQGIPKDSPWLCPTWNFWNMSWDRNWYLGLCEECLILSTVRRDYEVMGFKPLSPLYAPSKAGLWKPLASGERFTPDVIVLLLRFLPSDFKDLSSECRCLEVGGAFIGWAWKRILVTVNVALRGMWGSSTLFFFPCVTVSGGVVSITMCFPVLSYLTSVPRTVGPNNLKSSRVVSRNHTLPL